MEGTQPNGTQRMVVLDDSYWLPYVMNAKPEVVPVNFHAPYAPQPSPSPFHVPAPLGNGGPLMAYSHHPYPYYEYDPPPLPAYKQVKKRKRLTPDKLNLLVSVFQNEQKPTADKRKQLSEQTGMTPREVQVWFQNRRAKWKRERAIEEKRSPMGSHMSSQPSPQVGTDADPLPSGLASQASTSASQGTAAKLVAHSQSASLDAGWWSQPMAPMVSTPFAYYPSSASSTPTPTSMATEYASLLQVDMSIPVAGPGPGFTHSPSNMAQPLLNGPLQPSPSALPNFTYPVSQLASPLPNNYPLTSSVGAGVQGKRTPDSASAVALQAPGMFYPPFA
ncbi:hypothetical protein H4R34_000157 [Dimargaris verticillata]|uniref:Homeobox domain-containing protein n=1 Tax=Dimargaris verticillata TaxID=2761393 RepID=A0A9W8EBK2_9FUNG|nr:hypothetical protein H4R34_000157 [Dimargaris verticillata]